MLNQHQELFSFFVLLSLVIFLLLSSVTAYTEKAGRGSTSSSACTNERKKQRNEMLIVPNRNGKQVLLTEFDVTAHEKSANIVPGFIAMNESSTYLTMRKKTFNELICSGSIVKSDSTQHFIASSTALSDSNNEESRVVPVSHWKSRLNLLFRRQTSHLLH